MIVVADTGPVVHLHWVGASSWALPPEPILVVREVWGEIERHAPEALRDPRLVRAAYPAHAAYPYLAKSWMSWVGNAQ